MSDEVGFVILWVFAGSSAAGEHLGASWVAYTLEKDLQHTCPLAAFEDQTVDYFS